MEINIKLTVEEVNSLLGVLGQLPNSSGTFPLLLKIREQGNAQMIAQQAPAEAKPE